MTELLPPEENPAAGSRGGEGDDFRPTSMWSPVWRAAVSIVISAPIFFAMTFVPGRHGRHDFETLEGRFLFSILVSVCGAVMVFWKQLNN